MHRAKAANKHKRTLQQSERASGLAVDAEEASDDDLNEGVSAAIAELQRERDEQIAALRAQLEEQRLRADEAERARTAAEASEAEQRRKLVEAAAKAAEKQRAEKAAVEAAAREAGYESYEAYKAAVLAAEPAASAAAMGETASGHASGMTRSQSETDFLNRSRFVMRGKLKV